MSAVQTHLESCIRLISKKLSSKCAACLMQLRKVETEIEPI